MSKLCLTHSGEKTAGLDSRSEALEVLGLDESASNTDIKRRYRELASNITRIVEGMPKHLRRSLQQ